MLITNREVITNLNCLGVFVNIEKETGTALLSAKGEYAIIKNRKSLMGAYEPYEEALKALNDNENDVAELLDMEVEIVDLVKITSEDFRDGITASAMLALEFMTE